jgi:class 3 adenylate cyclase
MAFTDDLSSEVESILSTAWKSREGQKVPEAEDVGLGNDAVTLDATVLYADLAESTDLVNKYKAWFAAEIYKSYLHCSAKVIRLYDGTITSYDGDRIMAIFIGNSKNTSAAKAALGINYCITKIINPKVHELFPKLDPAFTVRQAVGIDTSELFIARTGIRGSNDLVWVGRAANYAAKLCALRTDPYASWITGDVYNELHESAKLSSKGESMWGSTYWHERNLTVYRSSWWMKP